MLIRNPAEFDHKAREWAVKYAGAPKKEIAEGSGGATAESITKKRQEAKQNEEKVKLAAYVVQTLWSLVNLANSVLGIMATTRTLLIDLLLWALTLKPLWVHSNMSVLTRWAVRTTNSRKRIWVTSLRGCLARHKINGGYRKISSKAEGNFGSGVRHSSYTPSLATASVLFTHVLYSGMFDAYVASEELD